MVDLVDEGEKLKRTLYVSGQNREVWLLTEDEPHAILGRAITTAKTSILVGDLAKILNQNGVNIGAKRMKCYNKFRRVNYVKRNLDGSN